MHPTRPSALYSLTRRALPLAAFVCATVSGCATTRSSSHDAVPSRSTLASSAATEEAAPLPQGTEPAGTRAHAVLTAAGRVFVLLGQSADAATTTETLLIPGGWRVELAALGPAPQRPFTLVGPTGQCMATSARSFALTLDVGGYSAARLPGRTQRALEVTGCASLAASDAFAIALDGRDESARWVHPAHLDDAPMPADRRLGENEVWIHRFALPRSDIEVVERTVLRYVTPSCSEELAETIVVDESDRPLSHHADFSLRGAIERTGAPLLVLVGRDEPHLRVVAADAEGQVALDAVLDGFEDDAHPGC